MPFLLKDTEKIAGGSAVQWKSWIRGFLDNGYQFGLLTWKGANQYINKKLEIDIVESYDPEYGIGNLRLFYYQLPKLYSAIKKYKPDFVIQSSATSHTGTLMLISKILRIPFIHRIASDVHVDERLITLISKKEMPIYKLGVKYADVIFTQNNYQFNKLKLKYPNKNIFVLHNPYAMDIDRASILPRKKRNYIAWVGNFRKIKNVPALLDITTNLSNINFKIAGVEAIEDIETRNAIEKLKKLNNVEFVGYLKRDELKTFLSKSIGLLNTSFTEGFSNTFLEAWSLGVPVITTKNVNPDGIINQYNLGKVADNYDHLPDMIKIIMDYDEAMYDKLALHYHEYVRENHNPKILTKKFVSYLMSIK